ncbi:MAG TPA: hypothetical protein VD993_09365 [Chitinophagaceae bacterium]|nr:hypothetical protein [Chitinophagaceae bacterium]
MEEQPKKINLGDPDKLPEEDRTSDSYLRNPGLKDEEVNRKSGDDKGLLNEDPLEEKRAIEDTSEDRLSEAE